MVHITSQSNADRYPAICQIGKGACGAVYLVRSAENKKLYALKKVQLDESRKTRTREAVQREANIMSEMKHPHIVAYYDSYYLEDGEHNFLCIIQDYCDGGTLDDRIHEATLKKQYIPEKQVIQLFLQIAMAVRYMHSKKVLHRDLKTQNVFLNKSATICKLGDFGIAKNMEKIEVASTCVGTPCYLSPEMCQDIPYSSKADVWALGCMLYEMLALKPAFDANNLVSLFYKIVKGTFEPIPDLYSQSMKDLVAAILVKSAEDRPSAQGVLGLPYVKAELLKFIEEKEMLQKRKLPTRQGSRPYSTSCLSRSLIAFFEEQVANGAEIPQLPKKRATSCRPVIVEKVRERSQMSARKHGRVSTIPEEPEDEQTRNLRIIQQIESNNNLQPIPEPVDTPRETANDKNGGKKQSKSQPKQVVPPLSVEIHQPVAPAPLSQRNRSNAPGAPSIKAVAQSPRGQAQTTAKSGKSSNSDNKAGPKRGSTPVNEHKEVGEQKMAKKSSSKESASNTVPQKNRSHTPHKGKDAAKKDSSKEGTTKTPSKDSKSNARKSAKSDKSKKSSSSTVSLSHIHTDTSKGSSTTNENVKNFGPFGPLTSSSHSVVGASVQEGAEDTEMLSPRNQHVNLSSSSAKDMDLTSSLTREKLLGNETPRNETDPQGKNNSKLVRKNSQSKVGETADSNSAVIIEERTVPLTKSSKSGLAESNSVIKLELQSPSKDSLPPINTSHTIITPELQFDLTPRNINPFNVELTNDAPRPVGMITKNLKMQDSLPKLIIQSEASFTKAGSRRSSGRRASRGSMRRSSGKLGSKKRLSGKHRLSDSISERPSTIDSMMSIPYEPTFDYYSDDFTDIETDSDISEDLEVPEEIPDLRKHSAEKYMFTQTFEIPDIEEDLPGGEQAVDSDNEDGEDYDEDFDEAVDDYSDIISVAKDLCDDLDKFHHRHNEVILDHESRRPSANVIIKQQFIDAMGKEKYNKVKAYFDNSDEIEVKKVEKMVGKENLKMAMMMKDKK